MKPWIPLTIATFLCWGAWAFLPRLTIQYIGPRSAVIYEVAGGVIVALFALAMMRFRPDTDVRGVSLAMGAGVLGFAGALCYLYAVTRGPVSLIAPVSALYPIVTILFAFIFLREKITLVQGVGIALGLVAIILITWEPSASTP